jgi:hypothetical protein
MYSEICERNSKEPTCFPTAGRFHLIQTLEVWIHGTVRYDSIFIYLPQLGFRSEMWCWRRMEKISWTDNVRNEKVLLRVKEQRNILHEISKRKANCIGHILRRN